MARPKMTKLDYKVKYPRVLFELKYLDKSLRKISRDCGVGLSTIMRIKKKFVL